MVDPNKGVHAKVRYFIQLGAKSGVLLKLFRIFVEKREGEHRALALSPALDQKMLKLRELS